MLSSFNFFSRVNTMSVPNTNIITASTNNILINNSIGTLTTKLVDPELIELQLKISLSNLIYICKRCGLENVGGVACINCKSNLLTKPEKLALNNLKLSIIKNKQKLNQTIITQITNLETFNLSKIENI